MENFNVQYGFSYYTPFDKENDTFPQQTSSQKNITMSDAASWHMVLREFANFLSGIYGYDITKQVFVQDLSWDSTSVEYTSIQDTV